MWSLAALLLRLLDSGARGGVALKSGARRTVTSCSPCTVCRPGTLGLTRQQHGCRKGTIGHQHHYGRGRVQQIHGTDSIQKQTRVRCCAGPRPERDQRASEGKLMEAGSFRSVTVNCMNTRKSHIIHHLTFCLCFGCSWFGT